MGKLTIQEISKFLVEKNGLDQRQANNFASEMFAIILERLQQGEQVKVKGLGTFKIISVDARESVSVRTGERVVIDSHSKVSFTPDPVMKELVNRPFSQFETVVLNEGIEFSDMKEEVEEDTLEEQDEIVETEDDQELEPIQEPEPEIIHEAEPEPEIIQETEPELIQEPEPVFEPESVFEPVPEPEMIQEPELIQEPEPVFDPEPEMIQEAEPVVVPEPEPEPIYEPEPEPEPEDDGEDNDDEEEEEYVIEEETNHRGRWLAGGFVFVALMVLSALGGYQYGSLQQKPIMVDTLIVHDTIYSAKPEDADSMLIGDDVIGAEEPPVEVVQQPVAQPVQKPVAQPAQKPEAQPVQKPATQPAQKPVAQPVQKPATQPAPKPVAQATPQSLEADKWDKKDERIRRSPYRIVGTAKVVTVEAGQTFYRICLNNLGAEKEFYVEVYNNLPQSPQIKVGQQIRIPKLERR